MFEVIGKQVKVGSRGSRRERVLCTKICMVRPKMQMFNTGISRTTGCKAQFCM